jgi:hypothetical protein
MKINTSRSVRMFIAGLMFIQMPMLIAGNNKEENISLASGLINTESKSMQGVDIYECMNLEEQGLSKDAFIKAWQGHQQLVEKGALPKNQIITIADFSKPSTKERLFILDLQEQKIIHKSLVAHGRNSGLLYAQSFSNTPETNKSSLGFYLTLNSYVGENGFSLRLKGLEKNINDKAYERAIVMHGAPYVSEKFAKQHGFIGRSLGCPAIPEADAKSIIKTIENGSYLSSNQSVR